MADNKWTLLYDYSRKCLDEDIDRFQLIDLKAEKFLTLVTAVIGIMATVSAWAFQTLMPPVDILTWGLFVAIILTFVCLASSWSLLFRAIKVTKVPRMPLSDQVVTLFWNNDLPDIYYALTKSCRAALDENRKIISMKGDLIVLAYRDISLSAFLVAVDVAVIVALKYLK